MLKIFKLISSLKKRYKQLLFYSNFQHYGFDAYIETFRDFYQQDSNLYQLKLQQLLLNLDDDSKYHVQRFLRLMLTLPLPSRYFLVKHEYLYDEIEKSLLYQEKKFINNINRYYKQYKLQGFEKLEVNVFKYHCGLKLLPSSVLAKIKKSIVIDGGAFWGDSALVLRKYAPQTLICFEPSSVNFKLLQQTVKNNLPNSIQVVLNNMGLSDFEGESILNYISNSQNHGASTIFKVKKHNKEELIKLTSLDNYYSKQNLTTKVGLIKLDVEGLGLKSLKGAVAIIKRDKPIISCAIYHNPEELFEVKTFLESIHRDYKFIIKPLSQGFILKELTLIAY